MPDANRQSMFIRIIIYKTKKALTLLPKRVVSLFRFLKEYAQFSKRNDQRFSVRAQDWYPCLSDRISSTPFDHHYTYHPAWAARILAQTKPLKHADFSSILYFGTMVSAFIPVEFYDFRPADVHLSQYRAGAADLTKLDMPDECFSSVSCMHTIEHIGLGRYGDPIDPGGDIKAINELKRITKKGGNLLLVTPVGKPRIYFNAHRVYSFEQIQDYFSGFELMDFSLVPDKGGLINAADPGLVADQDYGCGCFWFRKK